jgi:hypothetical protein
MNKQGEVNEKDKGREYIVDGRALEEWRKAKEGK